MTARQILSRFLYPYDYEAGAPALSSSERYVMRFWFNGCWRWVEIDDRLPTSKNFRVLHVVDRSQPGLLWPALLEKAYLKVRGGYNFPGSNSSTDLAVMTGWIPEQIFLHDNEVDEDQLWEEIFQNFTNGNLLLTMGTGELPKREQKLSGLAAEHDYAVLDLKQAHTRKEALLKNPWSEGDVWYGAARRRPNPSQEFSPTIEAADNHANSEAVEDEMIPGTFWMDFSSVFQHFENLYLNWNPGLFAFREDLHFSWDLSTHTQIANVVCDNPQFRLSSVKAGEVWLLLNRHFKTGDHTRIRNSQNGYICLSVYGKTGGLTVFSDNRAMLRGPIVNSPNTLLRLRVSENSAYTLVVTSQDMPVEKQNFTLSALSGMRVDVKDAPRKFAVEIKRSAAWTRSSAGGNGDCPHYFSNPQFRIELEEDGDAALLLTVPDMPATQSLHPDIHVKLVVVSTTGGRIYRLYSRDVVAHSGEYRRGSAILEASLPTGKYTVICSTFDPEQCAKFTLQLHSSSTRTKFEQLPAEDSGKYRTMSGHAIFSAETNRLLAPLAVVRMTKALFIARAVGSWTRGMGGTTTAVATSSLFKLSIEQGQGPYKRCIVSSAASEDDFNSLASGIRLTELDLHPDLHGPGTGGLWLVIERLSRQICKPEEGTVVVEVEALADERVQIGVWGYGEG